MLTDEAISKLSTALVILAEKNFDKEEVRALTDFIDEKHKNYIERGLLENDKSLVMHGVMGALSHYEAEKERETKEKRIHSIKENH